MNKVLIETVKSLGGTVLMGGILIQFSDTTFEEALKKIYEAGVEAERENSLKLWMLLDDIDTADDIAKTDHDTYRRLCRNTQQKRWAVLSESEVDAAIRARGKA
jgi:hypothetical protein